MSETMLTVSVEDIGGWDIQTQYATYSVDGLPASRIDSSKQTWHLQARPRSRIKFTIYQDKKKGFLSREKPLAHLEKELYALLTSSAQETFDFTPWAEDAQNVLKLTLKMSVKESPKPAQEPTNVDNDPLRHARDLAKTLLMTETQDDPDVRRICQSSERLLECVDQTVVPSLRQGAAIRTLFEELKETLDYTRTVKNSITEYSLVELARFVANSAALLDEGVRYATNGSDQDLRKLTTTFQSKMMDYRKRLDLALLESYNERIKSPPTSKQLHSRTLAFKESMPPSNTSKP